MIVETAEFLELLAKKLRWTGLGVATWNGMIPLTALGVDVRVQAVAASRGTARYGAQAKLNASGIITTVIGFGEDVEQALDDAAEQWLRGVFPLLHAWRRPDHPKEGVGLGRMLVQDLGSGRRFGWRVHLGPVQVNCINQRSAAPAQDGAFHRILDLLRQITTHTNEFSVEIGVTRTTAKEVAASCVCAERQWPEAEALLRVWAREWPMEEAAAMSMRQWLLFEPTSPEMAGLDELVDRELEKL